ncbi:MAG TPA: ATP-binding protein, partial [Caulobacteraceae bacterium]|nr:ATP-binding protein [Caulobacteraceae bacterium]
AIRTPVPDPGRASETFLTARFGTAPPVGETLGRHRLMFRDALARSLGVNPASVVIYQHGPRIVAFGGPRRARRPHPESAGPEPLLFGRFQLGVRQPDGRWLIVQPKGTLGLDPWQERLLLVFGLAALAVSPLAWAFSRRLAAPISALAAGAERLGRDPRAPPLDIGGSSEVAAAVAAFNEMQERLRRYVDDRTTMIGAIAHDLRTPLTRLRFRIEAIPDPLRSKLSADVDQMEAMVASTLGFVRDAATPRDRRKLEVASLVETVMDEAALTGADAAVEHADRVVVDGDPLALKRLVANLVDNALKYGASAHARVFTEGEMAVIEIDDDGPGMPDSEIERVFEPFRRLESSRSRETGGIGLGLAVVRAVARSHGGDVVLRNRPHGGLSARVTLPLSLGVKRDQPAVA